MDLYYASFVPSLLLDCLYQSAHYEEMDTRLKFREDECTHRWNEFAEYIEVNPDYDEGALPLALKGDWECGLRMVLELDLINPRDKGGCHFYDLLSCDFIWTEGCLEELFDCFLRRMIPTDADGHRILFKCHCGDPDQLEAKSKLHYYDRMAVVSDLSLTCNKMLNFWTSRHAAGNWFYMGNPSTSTCRSVILNDTCLRTYNFENNTVFLYEYSYSELETKRCVVPNKKHKFSS